MKLTQELKRIVAGLGLVAIVLMPSVGLGQATLQDLNTTNVIPTKDDIFTQDSGLKNAGDLFSSPQTLVATIFRVVIIVSGLIFLLMLLFGGITYLTSAGNDDGTGKAKKMMLDAVVGLIIVLSAWAIGTYILKTLGFTVAGGTSTTTQPTVPTTTTPTNGGSGTTTGGTTTNPPATGRTRIRQELRINTAQLTTDPGAQQARSNFYNDCKTPTDKTKEVGDVVATFSGEFSVFNCYRKLTTSTPTTTGVAIRQPLKIKTSDLNNPLNPSYQTAKNEYYKDCETPTPQSGDVAGKVRTSKEGSGTNEYTVFTCYSK